VGSHALVIEIKILMTQSIKKASEVQSNMSFFALENSNAVAIVIQIL